jgi:DNA-directed RNA polymerase II subunit RPB2
LLILIYLLFKAKKYSSTSGASASASSSAVDDEITQEDCWVVISSYFEAKGLVRQQLDSFDEFIQNTMQEIVDENGKLVLETSSRVAGVDSELPKKFEIEFGQVYLSKPTMTEADGSTSPMFPNEARLRGLTYAAPLYMDMRKRTLELIENPATGEVEEAELEVEELSKIFIGKVPIMLRSKFCVLSGLGDKDLIELGECPYDQGGKEKEREKERERILYNETEY